MNLLEMKNIKKEFNGQKMCIRDSLYTAGQTGETSEGCKSRLLLLQYPG